MKKLKVVVSPKDDRDYSIEEHLYSNVLPESYLAPETKVRCQWFSSQCVCYACTQAMSQYDVNDAWSYGFYGIYSPGFLYANREESDYQGEGWYIRQALKQLKNYGTCFERDFSIPESFKIERKKFLQNKDNLLDMAAKNKISAYYRCYTIEDIKGCIMQKGCCIISFPIYTRKYLFKSKLDNPKKEDKIISYHAAIIVGWTENNEWIIQDSYSRFRPKYGKFKVDFKYPIEEYWGIDF